MKKPTFNIYTLGCKVNQYDSNSLSQKLISAGFTMVKANADLAIINTCTVTHSAIAKDKKMIEKARTENPEAKLAVIGCLPVNYKAEVETLSVDYIHGTKDVDKFVKAIISDQFFATKEKSNVKNSLKIVSCELKISNDRSRYFMKVQDGCQQFCSYCIIPYNRGKLSSRSIEEVVREARAVTAAGFEELVLCGIHLGLYGVDLPVRDAINRVSTTLVDLLKELIKIKGLKKIRLSSIEVIDVNDELINLMASERKICRHLHIPLQAGTDKILKLMNRPYTTEDFFKKIQGLRKVMPEIAITTDVIVGFPGETDEDFELTREFVEKIKFSKLHVFPFSAHEKTPAFNFPGQLSAVVKKVRAKNLVELSLKLEDDYKQQFIGQQLEVIIDGRSKDYKHRGKTEYFFDVEFESQKKYRIGELVKVEDWRLV